MARNFNAKTYSGGNVTYKGTKNSMTDLKYPIAQTKLKTISNKLTTMLNKQHKQKQSNTHYKPKPPNITF